MTTEVTSKQLIHLVIGGEMTSVESGEFANLGIQVKPKLDLAQMMKQKSESVTALTKGLDFLSTYPWVKSTIPNWFRGDFANITMIIDLTLSRLDSSLFTGTRWEGNLTELEMQWGRTIGQMPSPYTAGNPLIAPYHFGGY